MTNTVAVTSWKYNATSRHLKIFYSDGSGELYYPVPEFIYDNLLRSTDKAAFVHKYLEFDLHFTRLSLVNAS
ncbi:KTSC domain-containing protein [Acinetobacter pittii]|uniref:KTSC domain-containing protein n=1 Tax=Acinetobacter pittii TaxID=48296 RepID=UPI00102335D8|nr:KTSC domain-containing protein [Acinetobacter pittii]RZH27177.1 KTSC domain-containing protein [Acinetobacter pittii]